VGDYVNVFVVGEARRESLSQTRVAAVVAGTDSQPRFEGQDRASQITARLFRNGQAHRAMRVEFPARFFNRLTLTTIRTQDLMIYSARAAESCSVQREAASIGFITSLQRIIVFSPFTIWATIPFLALHYSLVLGDCQVHRWRCYNNLS